MNEPGKQLPKGPDSHPSQHMICDACKNKDDEDVYIVFNVLYRVILGDIFYQRLTKDDLNLDVELLQEERSKQMTEEAKSGEEKLRFFQQEVSSEILNEIMTSSHFDQLLQEVFKSKYSRINETTCNHQDFARHFIDSFNISNYHNIKKEKTCLKLDRLDALLISIRKLKEDIQKYNAEISRLPSHIMTRLFESHATSSKKSVNRVDDAENNIDSSGNGKEDDSRQARSSNNNSGNGSSSSNGTTGSNGRSDLSTNYESNGNNDSNGSNQNNEINGSGEGGSSEQSTESNNANEPNRRRSKALPFKSKLPKKATDILKNWFLANINNPYPSHEAKEQLSKLTGLTRKQIQNWFTNSRKRFLEPLKKKIEGKKSASLTPNDLPVIEPVVDAPPAQLINNTILSQPVSEVPIQPNLQLKQVPQFISPIAAPLIPMNNNNPSIIKPIMPQRLQLPIQQPQIQNQAFLYQPGVLPQGVLPQGVLPQGIQGMLPQGAGMQPGGGNILIVPYIVPQSAPVTYYRQPEFVAVNPSFIQFPQQNVGGMGNIGPSTPNMGSMGNMNNMGGMQVEQQSPINQNQMVPYSYFVSIPQQQQQQQQHNGLVEMRPGNLANNFNTINNNIYNNINGLNGIGGSGNMSNMSNMGQMIPIALGNPNITPLMNMGNFGGIPQQANIAGMSHMAIERPGSVPKSNQGDFSGNIFDGSMASPRTLQRNIGGIYHPRPELDEMNMQGRKHLHKDHNPENDTN